MFAAPGEAEAARAGSARERGQPLASGQRLLKYDIVALCGRGGHACVYEAYDPFLDRRVAIKVIAGDSGASAEVDRRAQLEARVLCRLEHPNVVRVLDAGISPAGVFIVMEWLEGRSLRDVLQRVRHLTVREALSLAVNIAEGVHAAHELRVIHRDLKPENVMLLRGNQVKVLDFGIAKSLNGDGPTTERDLFVGTLRYMSPEHLLGQPVTARSDVYALGTVLYEALCGQAPCHVGIQNTSLGMRELVAVQITRVPPPLDSINPAVPRALALIVQCMLEKEPERRFASMAEVCTTLRALAARVSGEGGVSAEERELWLDTAAPSVPLAAFGPAAAPPSVPDSSALAVSQSSPSLESSWFAPASDVDALGDADVGRPSTSGNHSPAAVSKRRGVWLVGTLLIAGCAALAYRHVSHDESSATPDPSPLPRPEAALSRELSPRPAAVFDREIAADSSGHGAALPSAPAEPVRRQPSKVSAPLGPAVAARTRAPRREPQGAGARSGPTTAPRSRSPSTLPASGLD